MNPNFFANLLRAPDGEGAAAPVVATLDAPVVVDSVAAAPAANEAPVVDAAPAVVDSTVVETKAAESIPSLLEAAEGKKPDATEPVVEVKPGEEKPAEAAVEAKPDDAAKPGEEKTAEPPKPVTYEPFKLPDEVKLADEPLKQFSEIAGAAQIPQEVAQKMVDLYISDIQRVRDDLVNERQETWRNLNDGWKDALRKDPELGGNRLETNLSIAKAVIEEFGGTKEQQSEFFAHTSLNGMGNFPGFIRLLHNIGVAMNVFEDNIVAAPSHAPSMPKTRGEKWYGGNAQNGRGA